MTPTSSPTPGSRRPSAAELSDSASSFTLRMSVIGCETGIALDRTRDRHGRTVHPAAAETVRARRDTAAVEAYRTHLAPHAEALLDVARLVLDDLPPAQHLAGWQAVLDVLHATTARIRRILERPAAPGSEEERAQHAALWPHLTVWADHGNIASGLADQREGGQHQKSPLTDEERRRWTEMAVAAQRRGALELIESWYAADGQPITLAYLVEDDESIVVALRGDPGAPGWQVIGHYEHEYEAGRDLPAPVPPGVLRPYLSRHNRPAPHRRNLCRTCCAMSSTGAVPVTCRTPSSAPSSAVTPPVPWSGCRNLSRRVPSSPAPWRPSKGGRSPAGSPRWAARSSSSPAKSTRRPRTSARRSPSCPRTAPPWRAYARAPPWTPRHPCRRPSPVGPPVSTEHPESPRCP